MFKSGPRRRLAFISEMLLAAASGLIIPAANGFCANEPPSPASAKATDASPVGPRSSAAKPDAADPVNSPRIEGGQVSGRWREGSRLIDQLGYFKVAGDHVSFISSDGKLKFDGLENLAIERIARTIGDSPDQLEWSISGIITEYRGANYLLVTQAVLKTKAARSRRAP
jgi:hypothetical protein